MKLPYFKLKDAFNETRESFSVGGGSDKLASTAKLIGKTVANVGMLATEAGIHVAKRTPEMLGNIAQKHMNENSHQMSTEQKEKLSKIIDAGKDAKLKRENLERETRRNEDERH